MRKQRMISTYRNEVLDPLLKIQRQYELLAVIGMLTRKLDEYKKKNPQKDVTEQEKLIEYLEEVEGWIFIVWEDAMTEKIFNRNQTIQYLNKVLELRDANTEIKRLEDDLKTLKENIKCNGVIK